MGILLILGVCLGIAIILGVPVGISAGVKAAAIDISPWSAYFRGAFTIYVIQTVLLLVVSVFLVLGMEGRLGADINEILVKLRNFAYFSFLPIIFWLPVFTITFLVSKVIAS